MTCQSCGKKPATTHVKTIINGELTEYHLCQECAQSMGYGSIFGGFGLNVGDLIGSFFSGAADSAPAVTNTERCSMCGSSFEDIARGGQVGCAECYHTFYERLIPYIQRIHGNTKHTGKLPTSASPAARAEADLAKLRTELTEAVEKQEFERAAELRDRIKEAEGQGKQDE